jgi:predicted permease
MRLARFLRISRHRLRSAAKRDALDSELNAELAFHFEQLVRENIAQGMTGVEARYAAQRRLGNSALLAEQCRDHRRMGWLHDLGQDTVYGLRMLRKSPVFALVAAASLALGIGANTAVLGIFDSAFRSPLPYPQPDRLVRLHTHPLTNVQMRTQASLPEFVAWKARNRSFESIGFSLGQNQDLGPEEDGGPVERLTGHAFGPGLFQTLGIQPALGRFFTDAECRSGSASLVVVISHRLWQSRFGGDADVLGRTLRLGGTPRSIIGVMPQRFPYAAEGLDFWIPLSGDPGPLRDSARLFMVTARLKSGVNIPQAQADMDAIAVELAREFPSRHQGWGIQVQPLKDDLYGWTKAPLLTLEAAAGLVLLIACANVAGLLLARGSARGQEIAMRIALGASGGRIVRQLLTESVLLSLLGGAFGLLVAWWGLSAGPMATPPPGAPRLAGSSLNLQMLGITALTAVVTGLAFGWVPAFASFKPGVMGTLKNFAPTHTARHRLRGLLVTAQIALALVLSTGTGLLLKSFVRLTGRDFHFDTKGLLTFELRMPAQRFMHEIGTFRDQRYFEIKPPPSLTLERIHIRLAQLQGLESAAGISHPPVNSLLLLSMPVLVEGRPTQNGEGNRSAFYFMVTPGYFGTIKARIVEGRDLTGRDTVAAPWVAVINETAARRFWPGESPLGKRFRFDSVPDERPREVIGVVRDMPARTNQTTLEPSIYTSYFQQPSRSGPWGNTMGQMTFVLRASGDPWSLLPEARRAVAEMDPTLALANVATVEQFARGGRLQDLSSYVSVLGLFAFAATGLAAVGIYGVMAFAVAQRVHEIGIRRALGASPREVLTFVGARAAFLILGGIVAGIGGSLVLTRLLGSQLWGVSPTDLSTYVSVSALVAGVGIAACVAPLSRATRVDPTVALRNE